MHLKCTADKLFGDGYRFSEIAAGRFQMPFATVGAILGNNVRVWIEDSLFIERGELATSNAQQAAKIRTIPENLGHLMATTDISRETRSLNSGKQVKF